jgi:hypothetical protein
MSERRRQLFRTQAQQLIHIAFLNAQKIPRILRLLLIESNLLRFLRFDGIFIPRSLRNWVPDVPFLGDCCNLE